jgi:hypothetical protein
LPSKTSRVSQSWQRLPFAILPFAIAAFNPCQSIASNNFSKNQRVQSRSSGLFTIAQGEILKANPQFSQSTIFRIWRFRRILAIPVLLLALDAITFYLKTPVIWHMNKEKKASQALFSASLYCSCGGQRVCRQTTNGKFAWIKN